MKVVTVNVQKGGSGKTTLSLHLTYFFLQLQKKVVFIDLDPSGDATSTLNQCDIKFKDTMIEQVKIQSYDSDSLFEEKFNFTKTSDFILFKGTKLLIDKNISSLNNFKENLNFVNEKMGNDTICIIDGGPTAGVLQLASLISSNFLVIPIELDRYSLNAVQAVSQTLNNIQAYNPNVKLLGILPNRFQRTSTSQKILLNTLQLNHSSLLLDEELVVSQRQAVRDAIDQNKPVWCLKNKSQTARDVAKEMLKVCETVWHKIK